MPTQVSRPPMNRSWHEAQSGRGVRDRMALLWARRHTGSAAAIRGCMNMHRVLDDMLRRVDTGGGGLSAAKVLSQKSTQMTGPLTPATHRAPQLLRRRKHAAPPSLLVQPSAAPAPTPALPPPLGIWCTKKASRRISGGVPHHQKHINLETVASPCKNSFVLRHRHRERKSLLQLLARGLQRGDRGDRCSDLWHMHAQ